MPNTTRGQDDDDRAEEPEHGQRWSLAAVLLVPPVVLAEPPEGAAHLQQDGRDEEHADEHVRREQATDPEDGEPLGGQQHEQHGGHRGRQPGVRLRAPVASADPVLRPARPWTAVARRRRGSWPGRRDGTRVPVTGVPVAEVGRIGASTRWRTIHGSRVRIDPDVHMTAGRDCDRVGATPGACSRADAVAGRPAAGGVDPHQGEGEPGARGRPPVGHGRPPRPGSSPGSMIGKPHGSSVIRSGSSSAQTPAPSQATDRPPAGTAARSSRMPPAAGDGQNGCVGGHRALVAGGGRRGHRTSRSAVRTKRATPSGWRHAPRPSTRPHRVSMDGHTAAERPGPEGQLLDGGGQRVQPVDAGAALAGALALQVADHPGHLGEGARPRRQEHDHPGADATTRATGAPPR